MELNASDLWCHAFDSRAGDLTFFATARVQRKSPSFSTMPASAMKNAAAPGGLHSVPDVSRRMASMPSSSAATASAAEMNTVTSASILPCPYGWFSSAGATQYRTPRMTARSVTRSDAECAASAMSARDENMTPPTAFAMAMTTFAAMPA